METAISTKIITHAVILVGDIHHLIGKETNSMLEQAGLDDFVELDDGSKIKPSAIMDIMPITKYYEQYPDKKPAPKFEDKTINIQDFRSTALSRNGLESMIRGIKRSIEEFQKENGFEPMKSTELLQKALSAYKDRYGVIHN